MKKNNMKNLANEKFYERYSWMIFVIIGIIVMTGGLPHMLGFNTDPVLVQIISGRTINELKISDPMFFDLYNFYFSGGGLSDLGFAFLLIVISLTSYKQGQRWAWYAFCFIPVYFLAWIILSLSLPIESQSSLLPPLITIVFFSIVGLLFSFRKFFSKK